ncbi:DNA-processing protein DprA [Glacieibacterium frigidum]|uniref:DNA-protecting protein DprA n=1 Tax=Glacieibacterium frigidum TaxID=2593303 RepID=A0A552UAI4_9SPHN|nr:DNA-processing protein DprA [Glacieibacterium frigidum]TRW15228.1 DNA-protecting protein DprA [Glacieibacterium frigidum]
MNDDAVARLRLIRSDQIGPVTYRQLVQRFGSAGAALDALPDLARRGGGRPLRIATVEAAQRELDAVAGFGAQLIFIGTPEYPNLLARTETAPPAIAVKGDAALLERPAVGIVGARNASAAGTRFARGLASDLADAGLVVVSGLARGIDAAAHEGALSGGTVAVIAGGIDVAYPPETADLQRRIGESGLVVAEMPFGTQPQARHFPRRNRIIAGLCAGTVVVEGALRSGSLITARLAAEAGREVMAIPGSPLDPRAQGCNMLIREGATLVQSAADIVEAVSGFGGGGELRSPGLGYESGPVALDTGDAEIAAVTALLSPTPVPIDEIVRLSELPSAVVAAVLLDLELGGALVRHAGGRVALA